MKALDHYQKAVQLEQRATQSLSAPEDADLLVSAFQAAAHHYICAGLEWLGHDPQQYGHLHSKHAVNMKAAAVDQPVINAWLAIENARNKAFYGTGATPAQVSEARRHLADLRAWADGLRSLHP